MAWLAWRQLSQKPFWGANMSRNRSYESNAADLREQLKRVNTELVQIRKQLAELENERQGLSNAIAALDGIKLGSLPVSATTATQAVRVAPLRVETSDTIRMWGTLLDHAATVLRQAKTPLHVDEIVKRMQANGFKANRAPAALRASLVSGLDRRIARGETFYKPQPAVYGLREWESKTETA
jgi:hypothetical protein